MTVASTCPTPEQLTGLITGTLSDQNNELLTRHVENCTTCQVALQSTACGEVPIDSLLVGIDQVAPPDQSNYWRAVASVKEELSPSSVQQPTVGEMNANHPSQVESPTTMAKLDFLEPSDDPAYLGKLHHFQISRIIGQGGMGIVLEAFDTHLHRTVAIKVLNPQYQTHEVARQRFCREGRAAAAISHEHVVPMYQVAKAAEGEVAFLVMQLIEGDTLEGRLSDGRPLPPNEVARIGMQIAAGLSAAHKKEVVHRDIKPGNVLIEADTHRVKLTDFGLARAVDDVKLTKTGMVTGTPLYMSPEQALGDNADERSDLFSLGAVMYEMATGQAPFQAPSAIGVMQNITKLMPEPPYKVNREISRPLSDLIMSLLSKKPEDRPESASAVATALASIVSEYGPMSPLQVPAVAATEVKKISGSYRRNQRRWVIAAWLAGAIGLLSLTATPFLVSRPDDGDPFPSVVLPDNPGTVWSIDFTPDGKNIAAAIEDGSIRIWNVDDQTLLKSFNAHRGITWMVVYHPTLPLLMSSGDDGAVRLWNSETYDVVKEWKMVDSVRGVAFSPDGAKIAAGNRAGELRVFDIESGDELAANNYDAAIMGVDYSTDGKLVATIGSDKLVRLFDLTTLTERNVLSGHSGPIYGVKFNGKGPLVASVGWNKNIHVWNAQTGNETMSLDGSEGDIWGVAFCSDGSHLITGEQQGATRVWDLATGQIIATLRGHTSSVHNVTLDPTANRIATSSRDGTIRVWDMSSLVENSVK
ncbi:serine/threonine protein kinase [Rubripirellula amarantea]|nr:serine/threonine protein kinase [Rubripirellula amarantea]